MKNKKTEIAFFLFGLAMFVYLLNQFGTGQVAWNFERTGWSILGAMLVWLIIYVANTASWKLVLGTEGERVRFFHLLMVNISGFSIDTITPVIALGGEPYKVKVLSGVMGTREAFSAVVLFRMIHTVGHMLILLTGILGGLVFLALPAALNWILVAGGVIMGVVLGVTISGFREGVFRRIENVAGRFRLLRKLSTLLRKHEHDLHEMDRIVTDAYRRRPGKFYSAVFLEYFCRICMGIEVYLVLHGIGSDISLISALFVYVLYSVVINLIFFIPLNFGVREGSLYLGLQSLALVPALGLYLGVIIRVRELAWILIGLVLMIPLARMNGRPAPDRGGNAPTPVS